MFGNAPAPQNEETPFHPRSPYGIAKLYAHWMTRNYREAHGLFACCGILFNHESPLRGSEFVTRKITLGLSRSPPLPIELGNLDAQRDWGFAGDYVQAMWLMLQQEKPDDYVIATGQNHSVEDFTKTAFNSAGIDNWKKYIKISKESIRPAEVDFLVGDATKAKNILGWEPKVTFKGLVKMMVDADIALLGKNSQ
jgi:GDPmannose 4,6-dehydratase